MADLFIDQTESSPLVDFKENGNLLIEGRIIFENPRTFFDLIISWIDNHLSAKNVKFELKIEYVNTSSSKMLIEILNILENKSSIRVIKIDWHYEMDDPDMAELGEAIESQLNRTRFNYYEYVDAD